MLKQIFSFEIAPIGSHGSESSTSVSVSRFDANVCLSAALKLLDRLVSRHLLRP